MYGPRQALANPYTGVLAIFGARLLNGNRPLIFEDGEQRRDFVSVHDVARACRLALDVQSSDAPVINIGSGQSCSVREIAERLSQMLGRVTAPELTGRYRVGDIRHCFADIGLAKQLLGYEPEVTLADGLIELTDWLEHEAAPDHVPRAHAELISRGLAI